MVKTLGYIAIVLGLGLIITAAYVSNDKAQIPIVFSPRVVLSGTWYHYKNTFWDPSTGRTTDTERNVTTSEAQSYTMLRAVWMDDQPTFDKTWEWTTANLKHKNDDLFAWLYGKRPDGTDGILTEQGGNNSASDADTDIALALIFASSRWNDSKYMDSAKAILNDIWKNEVVTIKGSNILTSDDIEKNSLNPTAVINPSYFSPYAYKVFGLVDNKHDWNSLADSSYKIIEQSSTLALDRTKTSGLPPDWLLIDKTTGEMSASLDPNLTTNFGYEAVRLPWRLALDWEWNKDPRAKVALSRMGLLRYEWVANSKIDAVYDHTGESAATYETPAAYGGNIGYFVVVTPELAKSVYFRKLQYLYDPAQLNWKNRLSYYDSNWAWFGIALYNNALPNLYSYSPPTATLPNFIKPSIFD